MLSALALALLLSAAEGPSPIRLHPENPRYFLFRDRPAFLLTSGEHYGAVLNRDFDRVPYLNELQARGFNLTRVFSGTYREVPGSFHIRDNTLAPRAGRLASPWVQVQKAGEPEKFDLDRLDDAYFARLREFVADAGRRGIVVEYVLFCPLYDDSLWAVSPMNARNNVNGLGDCPRTEALTLKHEGLVRRQLAFVRRAVAELNGFDNVYFEVCNEPYFGGVTPEWQARVAEAIGEAEMPLPNRHMIAVNVANADDPAHPPVIDPKTPPNSAASLFNFHYATPPAVLAKNRAVKAAIGDDETGFRGTSDRPYRTEAWEFLLSGGSLYNNLDYSFSAAHPDGSARVTDPTPGGGGPGLRSQLAMLGKLLAAMDFLHMAPVPEVLGRCDLAPKARVQVFGRPGTYVAYVTDGPKATLRMTLPAGRYRFEWLDPRNGAVLASGTIEATGTEATLASPEYAEDVALKIHKDATP